MKTLMTRMAERGLSEAGLVVAMEQAGKPVGQSTVRRWIRGEGQPQLQFIPALCEALVVTPAEAIALCMSSCEARERAELAADGKSLAGAI